jgi:hypothetical protein
VWKRGNHREHRENGGRERKVEGNRKKVGWVVIARFVGKQKLLNRDAHPPATG